MQHGEVYGVEFTASYTHGGFSTYANIAYSVAKGEDWNSAQFLFRSDPTLAYVKNHWIYLDHDQTVTGSFGAAYTWNEGRRASTRLYVDAIYGSGLRTTAADDPATFQTADRFPLITPSTSARSKVSNS